MAYTNWMRNFDDYFIFKKEIEIINARDNHPKNMDTIESMSKVKIDLQFFPEGGSLVEGVNSRVGFKATNNFGKGCKVSGKIISSLGDTCALFEGNQLGMGSFFFTPKKGLKYHVEISSQKFSLPAIDFPNVMETGYAMKISSPNDSNILIILKTNELTQIKYPNQE